jgi:hypothetical protein
MLPKKMLPKKLPSGNIANVLATPYVKALVIYILESLFC